MLNRIVSHWVRVQGFGVHEFCSHCHEKLHSKQRGTLVLKRLLVSEAKGEVMEVILKSLRD